jgi:hypothetical protein
LKPKKVITKKLCDELIDHMSLGADFKSFAGKVGVSDQALRNWRKQNPEFEEAYQIGLMKSYTWWEKKSREVFASRNKMDVGMFVINMRNRFGWLTRDKETAPAKDEQDAFSEHYANWEKRKSER